MWVAVILIQVTMGIGLISWELFISWPSKLLVTFVFSN